MAASETRSTKRSKGKRTASKGSRTKKSETKSAEPSENKPPSRWSRLLRSKPVRFGTMALAGVLVLPLVLTVLYTVVPPVSTLMLRDLVTLRGYERDWIDLENAAPVLRNSILASEDQTFCTHNGVEWEALEVQFQRWRAGEEARGASTLSMQVARNLFLWQGRSSFRKALEVPLALLIDTVWSKKRMMEIYINIAEQGPQLYGFEASAQRSFGRSAADVSRRQAALMVAALPLPSERDPARPTSRQARLADVIAGRARQMGGYNACLLPEEG